MSMLGCLFTVIVVVQIFNVAFCCPPSPRPCSWTTCRHEWRNDWSPSNPPQGRCVESMRKAHYRYIRHGGRGSCPAPRPCKPSVQGKVLCSCRDAYSCALLQWSQWTGETGDVSNGTCKRQSRTRSFKEAVRYLQRDRNCNGIKSSCGSAQYDYRTMCSCRYAVCNLGSWSSWTDLPSPVSNDHCASQRRQRSYTLTWAHVEQKDNCNGTQPQSCPGPEEETREKDDC